MALMHGHVNEWHSIKARNKHKNPNLSMLKTTSIQDRGTNMYDHMKRL